MIYKDRTARDGIIAKWERIYGERWYECSYHLRPDINIEMVGADGKNTNTKTVIKGSYKNRFKNIRYGKIHPNGLKNNHNTIK